MDLNISQIKKYNTNFFLTVGYQQSLQHTCPERYVRLLKDSVVCSLRQQAKQQQHKSNNDRTKDNTTTAITSGVLLTESKKN